MLRGDGVERVAAAGGRVGAQELVDAGRRPALAPRDQPADDRLDAAAAAGSARGAAAGRPAPSGAAAATPARGSAARAGRRGRSRSAPSRSRSARPCCCRRRARARCRARRARRPARARSSGASNGARSGLTESPKPGRSTAITRYVSPSAPIVGRNEAFVPPSPWTASSGGPLPASPAAIGPNCVSTVQAQAPGPRVAAGGGEEADGDVQVWRIRSPPRRSGPRPPGSLAARCHAAGGPEMIGVGRAAVGLDDRGRRRRRAARRAPRRRTRGAPAPRAAGRRPRVVAVGQRLDGFARSPVRIVPDLAPRAVCRASQSESPLCPALARSSRTCADSPRRARADRRGRAPGGRRRRPRPAPRGHGRRPRARRRVRAAQGARRALRRRRARPRPARGPRRRRLPHADRRAARTPRS